MPDVCTADVAVLPAIQNFQRFLELGKPGSKFCYFEGELSKVCCVDPSDNLGMDQAIAIYLRAMAQDAYRRGRVVLVQQRGPVISPLHALPGNQAHAYRYLAIKTDFEGRRR